MDRLMCRAVGWIPRVVREALSGQGRQPGSSEGCLLAAMQTQTLSRTLWIKYELCLLPK